MTLKSRPKIYVGIHPGGAREVFYSASTPTETSHGHLYSSVIGPFRTVRGARFMAEHGAGNPHVQTVSDAERIARQEEIKARKVIGIQSTELETWFERDRAHIELKSKLDDKTIVEWWDDAVSEAFEDGFLASDCFIFGKLSNVNKLHTAVYEYAKSHGLLPRVLPHYIAMSGMHGCLPDHCEVYSTRKGAVDDLVALFELGRTRAAKLRKEGYLELPKDAGAEYCEITECDCDDAGVHSDSGEVS